MSDFHSFAIAHGLQIDKLYPADRVQRCSTVDKPRSKNGAWFFDGVRGWVCDWAQGGELHWFDGESKTFTSEQRKAWARKKGALQSRQEEGWTNAALTAAIALRATKPAEHNYLHSKGLGHVLGLVNPEGDLLVPMRNFTTNELVGAQLIRWLNDERRYEKKMMPGMRAKGAVLRLGPKHAQETYLLEGYATGLSVEMAARQMHLSASVLVTFSDSNMVYIAPMVKGPAYCFADNDESGAGLRAAEKIGFPWCMSETKGFDANDLHKKSGLLAVCKLLMNVRRQ